METSDAAEPASDAIQRGSKPLSGSSDASYEVSSDAHLRQLLLEKFLGHIRRSDKKTIGRSKNTVDHPTRAEPQRFILSTPDVYGGIHPVSDAASIAAQRLEKLRFLRDAFSQPSSNSNKIQISTNWN
jgi:hypothetical protein